MTSPATPPPKKTNTSAGLGCLVVLGIIVWAVMSRGSGSTSTPAAIVPPPAATVRPAPVTLLSLQGNGIKKSTPFRAGGPWTLEYDFNCASFGTTGNFGVVVYGTDGTIRDVAVNELAAKGHDTTQSYETGDLYLDMNSECSWAVKVTG